MPIRGEMMMVMGLTRGIRSYPSAQNWRDREKKPLSRVWRYVIRTTCALHMTSGRNPRVPAGVGRCRGCCQCPPGRGSELSMSCQREGGVRITEEDNLGWPVLCFLHGSESSARNLEYIQQTAQPVVSAVALLSVRVTTDHSALQHILMQPCLQYGPCRTSYIVNYSTWVE